MNRSSVTLLLLFVLAGNAAGVGSTGASAPGKERIVFGWLESIFIKPWNMRLTAKLDTGAKTSSLHTEKTERFTKGGQTWVRFQLTGSRRKHRSSVVVERPLVRTVYIKDRLSPSSRRDVITLAFCKNGKDYETEFTLVDRSNFNYPVLLGRNFLKDVALVDANATFLIKARSDPCTKTKRTIENGRQEGPKNPSRSETR
jgi:hypothetical protein